MPGTFLFPASTALFHSIKLDVDGKQEEANLFLVPYGSYNEPCSAGCLLCSQARPPASGVVAGGGNNSRNRVLLKDRKDQKREHKNIRYLYIWVTGQVTERQQGNRSKLPQKMYVEPEWCTS